MARVLIVEDEASARHALATLLQICGHVTTAVGSAEEALELIRDKGAPQVALVDLDLPGMNGLDLIRLIEAEAPESRSVLMTATDRERLQAALARHQGLAYLRKPLDFRHLLGLIGSDIRAAC